MKRKTLVLFVVLAILFAGTAITRSTIRVNAAACGYFTSYYTTFYIPCTSSTSYPSYSSSGTGEVCNHEDDGRLDPVCLYPAQSVAVYCDIPSKGDVHLILVVKGDGVADFTVPAATIAAKTASLPAKPLVIAKKLGITLKYLPSGGFEVNGPADFEGKVFVFRWAGC